jgi:uncharacterized protein with FMN-binding domain
MNARTTPSSERDLLEARLAALASRRPAGTRPATVTTGPVPTPTSHGRGKRRHPAQGSRIASLGLSVASTGALAAFFAMSNAGAGDQVAAASIVAGPSVGVNGAATAVPAPGSSAATWSPAPSPTVVDVTLPAAVDAVGTANAADEASAMPAAPVATRPATAQAVVVQGGVFHNKWGDVQVQASFGQDGSLVDVVTLQTPSRDGKSVRINDSAAPQLNGEALSVQSADVHTVSGATYTSNDYRRSLQSAIDVARQAGVTTIA